LALAKVIKMTLADQILAFYKTLKSPNDLPAGVEVMNPFQNPNVFTLCEKFYNQFYNDPHPRKIIMGINPGRLGSGMTGIPFTDPVKLEKICGIPNPLPKKVELSADFIYTMMESYGGTQVFYSKFLFSSVCPLGFTKNGVNMNYYDDALLEKKAKEFIISSIQTQLKFSVDCEICYCMGEGQNYKYLLKVNSEYSFFKKIIPLPHPRFIMQYKRKKLHEFIDLYIQKLNES
jgi:hypothetical protein